MAGEHVEIDEMAETAQALALVIMSGVASPRISLERGNCRGQDRTY
jgi:hypothetical protein